MLPKKPLFVLWHNPKAPRSPAMEMKGQRASSKKEMAPTMLPKAAKGLPMDDTDTTQLSNGEYSQDRRSTGETRTSRTNQSSQPSDHGQKFDVFLSHSGKQKNFVRQLHKDLTNQGVSCFFDQDRESLPVAEHFPSRIFEAAKTCKVAVLLLSKDFLETKWPMLELAALVEARDITLTNRNLKILPMFFLISPDALKNTEDNDEKWKRVEKSSEERAKWHRALKAIRPINGLLFGESGDEVKFRDEIVKEIWHILPTPSPRYHVRGMQGEERMCQEVANFFIKVEPNKKGIRIAGLYGIAGHGKTTLGKAFCNFKLGDFGGSVCHLEFTRGDSVERVKLALQYLTHRRQADVQALTNEDQAKVELYRRVKDKTVLLVLDNITEESIDEVEFYSEADLGKNSWILLSARSVDVLEKHFIIGKQSCMRIPRLKEEEAIAILLERAFAGEPKLEAEERGFALKRAKRCLFKETCCDNVRPFHALALKAFGGYLFSKYGSNLSKWAAEIDRMVDRAGDGLDELFTLLGKAFEDMCDKYRTIFMLLTVYMLPNMSLKKVTEWMAINCNEEISFIEKAVEDLRMKAFIEEFKPEIRIHDLYIEFAQRKANDMTRWLWRKEYYQCSTRQPIAQDKDGFELVKLEQCMYPRIAARYLGKVLVLQLVDVDVKKMSKIDLGPMDSLRSITLRDCKLLAALDGMEKLLNLAWLQIRGVHPMFKLPKLSSLEWLQYLEIDIAGCQVVDQLGDLTHCSRLREINVLCPSLLEFPRLEGMSHLEKVEFSLCDKVKGPLDCRNCVKLQTIVLNLCCQMAASPLVTGCKKLLNLVLSECDAVTACPDIDMPSALKTLELFISSTAASAPKNLEACCELEYLKLWNMGKLMELPSFKRLSNLTVLKLGKCSIRELADLTGCDRLENVYLFQLKSLDRFPSFSSLRELKKLSLCNCISVEDPPDIEGCYKLQVFHLLYNDNMKGLPMMDNCAQLEEIHVSWHAEYEVHYDGFNPNSCQVDEDLEFCLEHFKDEKFGKINDARMPYALKQWEWVKGKTVLVKRYFRGVKLYYSLTVPYEDGPSNNCSKNVITLKMINGKVTPITTMGKDSQDGDWFDKVKGYFAGKKDNARASVCSGECENVEDISLRMPRYHVSAMQGEARLCQKVAYFFNAVHPNERGIRIAGLYGMPGSGKTTLGKAFCNLNMRYYERKVFHIELCGGNALDRQKLPLEYLTHSRKPHFEWVRYFFCTKVEGQRVLLVLDNITEDSIHKVREYLGAELGEGSYILLIARSVDVLKNFKIVSMSCMCIPRLREEEALAILLERMPVEVSALETKDRGFALKCAKSCSYKEDNYHRRTQLLREGKVIAPRFHPLALKALGRCLFSKHVSHLSKWVAEIDGLANNHYLAERNYFQDRPVLDVLFKVLLMAFDRMDRKSRSIFLLLTLLIPFKMYSNEVIKWVAENCKEEVKDLYDSAFIEEIEPQIRIHDAMKEFAKTFEERRWRGNRYQPFPPSYCVPAIQGEKLANFFNTVRPNKNRIRIAGLYGMPGQGKTTLAKEFCNRYLDDFDGQVCYLQVCGGNTLERLKIALQYLAHCYQSELESLTSENEAKVKFDEKVKGKRVLLVLDNIETDESIDEVRDYLGADMGEGSCILLIARSVDVLLNNFKIKFKSCMGIPSLTEEEAIPILLEKASQEKPALSLFCEYAFGIPTNPSHPHLDKELVEQVQAECRGLPPAVQEIVSSIYGRSSCEGAKSMPSEGEPLGDYHKDGPFNRLKTSIGALDDDEKQCFFDLVAFPLRKCNPASALLDIWVYVRGMNRDKAAVLLLKFAALHLLHLRRDNRLTTVRDDCMDSYTFFQDGVERNVALFLAEHDNRNHFRRIHPSMQSDFYPVWQPDRCQSSEAQIVSIYTGAMTDTQWPQMDFPEVEALVLYFNASDYCIPTFLFEMKKIKVLIIRCGRPGNRRGLDNFQEPSQTKALHLDNFQVLSLVKTLHLDNFDFPSRPENGRIFESLEKIHLRYCKGLGLLEMFNFPGLLECYLESCKDLTELPAGICSSKSLEVLSLTDCDWLSQLPDELVKLGSLKEMRLHKCSNLTALPYAICKLIKLEILDISGTGLYLRVEENLKKLAKLPSLKCLICSKTDKQRFESISRLWLEVVVDRRPGPDLEFDG